MSMHKSGRNDVASPGASVKQDITLSDYIARKQEQPVPKKLSFEEWYILNELETYGKTEYDCMKISWKAAQENKA